MKLNWKINSKDCLSRFWLIGVLAVFIFLRLPSLFEPFTYGDEGIYLTLGQAARKGLVWYRDIHDNKPPMLYLVAAIADDFSAYRLIHFAWSLITIFTFWQLTRLVFLKNRLAEIVSTTGFTILSSLHALEGNVGNAENFMLLPTIAGFYLVFEGLCLIPYQKFQRWTWLLAGLLFGIATLFKVPAAFDLAAALIFVFLIFLKTKKKVASSLFTIYFLLITGFLFPVIVTFIYYFSKGALGYYFIAAFSQNLPYLSSWSGTQNQAGGLPMALIIRGLIVFFLVGWLFVKRKRVRPATILIFIWFAFSWFAALLSSRPYPHYLLQLLPGFCLSLGLLIPKDKKSFRLVFIPLALALIFRLTFLIFHFWQYPNLPYYQNFYQYLLGNKSRQEYLATFDPEAQEIYETADYLRARSFSQEKIFIWGTKPSLYALSRRLPVGRYAASYHIIDFNAHQETLSALEKDLPRYLLVTGDEKRQFSELEKFIKEWYVLDKQIGKIKIFRRIIIFSKSNV